MSGPRIASSVAIGLCEHGSIHVELLDADGATIADGALGPETAVALFRDFGELIQDMLAMLRAEHVEAIGEGRVH